MNGGDGGRGGGQGGGRRGTTESSIGAVHAVVQIIAFPIKRVTNLLRRLKRPGNLFAPRSRRISFIA